MSVDLIRSLDALKDKLSFIATGNYHGKIMDIKVKNHPFEEPRNKYPILAGIYTGIVFGAIGVYAFLKSASDTTQDMLVTDIKADNGNLSIFGFCLEGKKNTPTKGDNYHLVIKSPNDNEQKILNILKRFHIYYQEVSFYNDFPYLKNKNENDYYSLLQQAVVWTATDNFPLSEFIARFFHNNIENEMTRDDIINVLMLSLYILREADYEITNLTMYNDVKTVLEIMYLTKSLDKKVIIDFQEKYEIPMLTYLDTKC